MALSYPVDMAVEILLNSYTDENGELTVSEEQIAAEIEQLQMEFDEKIVSLRNAFKAVSIEAKIVEEEAKMLRAEADSTQKRANALKNRAERIKRYVSYLLNGEEYKKNGVSIGYRSTTSYVVEDGFAEWALENAPELLKVEPRKSEISAAIKQGISLEYVHEETKRSIQIR